MSRSPDRARRPAAPSAGRGRRGGSRRGGRRGRPRGCAPRRAGAGGRWWSSDSCQVTRGRPAAAARGGRQRVEHGLHGVGRRGRRRRTTPRTPRAAGRRPGRASSGRTRRTPPVSWRCAAVEVADRAVGEEHREHRAGGLHDVRDAGLGERRGGRGLDRVAGRGRGGRRRRRSPGAGWRGRRWWRSGSPRACRPGRRGPRARACAITSARPPNAAAGKPPPITLPKVIRSGVQPSTAPSRPHWPWREARKPVITSSLTNSAPWARAGLGEEPVEARLRRDDAHVARRRPR